ncbi:MAG: hypothetical protein LBI55_01765 [Oscillospiraceae bacterium]|jgi:hypothetical protein|nr:hypothetical protein [Oscillospiraceae bacterium]
MRSKKQKALKSLASVVVLSSTIGLVGNFNANNKNVFAAGSSSDANKEEIKHLKGLRNKCVEAEKHLKKNSNYVSFMLWKNYYPDELNRKNAFEGSRLVKSSKQYLIEFNSKMIDGIEDKQTKNTSYFETLKELSVKFCDNILKHRNLKEQNTEESFYELFAFCINYNCEKDSIKLSTFDCDYEKKYPVAYKKIFEWFGSNKNSTKIFMRMFHTVFDIFYEEKPALPGTEIPLPKDESIEFKKTSGLIEQIFAKIIESIDKKINELEKTKKVTTAKKSTAQLAAKVKKTPTNSSPNLNFKEMGGVPKTADNSNLSLLSVLGISLSTLVVSCGYLLNSELKRRKRIQLR